MGVQSPSDCLHADLSSNFPNIIPTISISSSTHLLVPEFSLQLCTQKFLHLSARGICPRPGVEAVPPALEAWSYNLYCQGSPSLGGFMVSYATSIITNIINLGQS